ncbi:unnamed protein product [Protopolystoma xenopodis]|uniref:Oxysterol-binding protein n=1 Tax=Protopolystoma xenopodis TaxID=117903 RepID=A0A3S5C4J3_9PLAT|nr:unnamed protein product [Protopolystoma xenopodis]
MSLSTTNGHHALASSSCHATTSSNNSFVPDTIVGSSGCQPIDELYDDDAEEDLGSMQSHGSVISYLLSQLRIGMDLTRITLPTFILERRSALEMYADFLTHADLWTSIPDGISPRDRMIACLRWYLSAFHAGRRSEVAKKPYNPILGEIFHCYWTLDDTLLDGQTPQTSETNAANSSPASNISCSKTSTGPKSVTDPSTNSQMKQDYSELMKSGPSPMAPLNSVVFIAEQFDQKFN